MAISRDPLAPIERRLRRVRIGTLVTVALLDALAIAAVLLLAHSVEGSFLIEFLILLAAWALLVPLTSRGIRKTMAMLRAFTPRLRDAVMTRLRGIVLFLDNGLTFQMGRGFITVQLFLAPSGAVLTPRLDDFLTWTRLRKMKGVGVATPKTGPPELQAALADLRARLGRVRIFANLSRNRAAYLRPDEPSLVATVTLAGFLSAPSGDRIFREVDSFHRFLLDVARSLGGGSSG